MWQILLGDVLAAVGVWALLALIVQGMNHPDRFSAHRYGLGHLLYSVGCSLIDGLPWGEPTTLPWLMQSKGMWVFMAGALCIGLGSFNMVKGFWSLCDAPRIQMGRAQLFGGLLLIWSIIWIMTQGTDFLKFSLAILDTLHVFLVGALAFIAWHARSAWISNAYTIFMAIQASLLLIMYFGFVSIEKWFPGLEFKYDDWVHLDLTFWVLLNMALMVGLSAKVWINKESPWLSTVEEERDVWSEEEMWDLCEKMRAVPGQKMYGWLSIQLNEGLNWGDFVHIKDNHKETIRARLLSSLWAIVRSQDHIAITQDDKVHVLLVGANLSTTVRVAHVLVGQLKGVSKKNHAQRGGGEESIGFKVVATSLSQHQGLSDFQRTLRILEEYAKTKPKMADTQIFVSQAERLWLDQDALMVSKEIDNPPRK